VVYAPVLKDLYIGIVGKGAVLVQDVDEESLNNNRVTSRLPLDFTHPYRVVASRSHMNPETKAYVEELRATHPDLELISKGSSLKLCMIAT